MKKIFLLGLLSLAFAQTQAQIKAITESGNTVILYKNGTWEYYEGETTKEAPAPKPEKIVPVAPIAATSSLNIDQTATAQTARFELFNEVSPKMARYFGEKKGKIRCQSIFYNNKGEVQLSFEINVPVGDANRYFGKSLAETNITLNLQNDHKITIPITDKIEEKFIDKYNQSYYVGAGSLSEEDLKQILASPLESVDVNWKKNPESYNVENRKALQKALTEIL